MQAAELLSVLYCPFPDGTPSKLPAPRGGVCIVFLVRMPHSPRCGLFWVAFRSIAKAFNR
jgi:hypothetical protein